MRFRCWLAEVSVALAVATVILTFPAHAQNNPCSPLSSVLEKIEADTRLIELRVLSGKKLKLAVQIFNSVTNDEVPWPDAYFALRADGFGMLMVGVDYKICFSVEFEPNGTRIFLKDIDGEAI